MTMMTDRKDSQSNYLTFLCVFATVDIHMSMTQSGLSYSHVTWHVKIIRSIVLMIGRITTITACRKVAHLSLESFWHQVDHVAEQV